MEIASDDHSSSEGASDNESMMSGELPRPINDCVIMPGENTATTLGRLAISSFLKPSSQDNIFNAFFKSVYSRNSWVHYALTYPVPNVSNQNLRRVMALMFLSLLLQLKYSRETRLWARSIGHKGLFIATLFGMSGISIIGLIKYMIDRSREKIEKEDNRTK